MPIWLNCICLSTSNGTSVIEIIDTVKRVTGKDFKIEYVERRTGDPAVLIGNNLRAKNVLGWILW